MASIKVEAPERPMPFLIAVSQGTTAPGMADQFAALRQHNAAFMSDVIAAAKSPQSQLLTVLPASHSPWDRRSGGVVGFLAGALGWMALSSMVAFTGVELVALAATTALGGFLGARAEKPAAAALPSSETAQRERTWTKLAALIEGRVRAMNDGSIADPVVLAGLGVLAEHMLNGQATELYARVAIDDTAAEQLRAMIMRGQTQRRTVVARAKRWIQIAAVMDQVKRRDRDAEHLFVSAKKLVAALPADERDALRPLVRDAFFDGERPRDHVEFDAARDLYAVLAEPRASTVDVAFSLPTSEASLGRFVAEVTRFERALAAAIDPDATSLEQVLRTRLLRVDEHVPVHVDAFTVGTEHLNNWTRKANEVIDAERVRGAVRDAMAPWHTSLERAGLAIVASRCLELLDGANILGAEARTLLASLQNLGDVSAKEDQKARRLYNAMRALQAVTPATTDPGILWAAAHAFEKEVLPGERPAFAAPFFATLYGDTPLAKLCTPASLALFHALRPDEELVGTASL